MNWTSLLNLLSDKFGLGAKSGDFLDEIIYIIRHSEGGAEGFYARVRTMGFGSMLQRWLDGSNFDGISSGGAAQLFGVDNMRRVGELFGLSSERANQISGSILPFLTRAIGVNGSLPEGDDLDKKFIALKSQSNTTVAAVAAPSVASAASSGAVLKSEFPPVFGLIAAGTILFLLAGSFFSGQKPAEVHIEPAHESAKVEHSSVEGAAHSDKPTIESHETAKVVDPVLLISKTSDGVQVRGLMEAGQQKILEEQAKAQFGEAKIQGTLNVGADSGLFSWFENSSQILALLNSKATQIYAEGKKLAITGNWSKSEEESLRAKLAGLVGPDCELDLTKAFQGLPAPTPVRSEAAANAALSNLEEGFTAEELVAALNLCVINFNTGSATISPTSMSLLKKAAEVMKKAPAGTRIEVGGHTDSVGNPGLNLNLSTARAQAVVKTLKGLGVSPRMLDFKGYGSAKPVKDNGTPAGRAANSRMEFTLINP